MPSVDPRFLVPAGLACLTLFGGGLALGTVTGSAPAQTRIETFTTSLTHKGKVITVNGVKKVRIPARTVTRKGKVVTLPASTVDLTATRTVNGTVLITRSVPTTVVRTQTQTQTQTRVQQTTVTSVSVVTSVSTTTEVSTSVSTTTETVTLPVT